MSSAPGNAKLPEPLPVPLCVLHVLANPADLPRYDAARLWGEMEEALLPFRNQASLTFEKLDQATENALRKSFAQWPWHVLHLVAHGQERSSANYGTVALQSSDGSSRNLTANYLASLLTEFPSLRLVVLQGCEDCSTSFDTVAEALLAHGVPAVVLAPSLSGKSQQMFLAKLYAGLLMGLSAEEISSEFRSVLKPYAPRLLLRNTSSVLFAVATSSAGSPTAANVHTPIAVAELAWHEVIDAKRRALQFDVFLCHNSADKPEVKCIGQQLKESGILPWLDVWELPPGQSWQKLLEQQIGSIKSAAVCFGAAGIGPWQEREMEAFLSEFVDRGVPVIPVLLPDAPRVPELPIFLRGMTWVDFRCNDPDPLKQLIWGVTQQRPND